MNLTDEANPQSVLTESSLAPRGCGSTDAPDDLGGHCREVPRRKHDSDRLNAKVIDDHASAHGVPISMNQDR
jgi:hypothetical protein